MPLAPGPPPWGSAAPPPKARQRGEARGPPRRRAWSSQGLVVYVVVVVATQPAPEIARKAPETDRNGARGPSGNTWLHITADHRRMRQVYVLVERFLLTLPRDSDRTAHSGWSKVELGPLGLRSRVDARVGRLGVSAMQGSSKDLTLGEVGRGAREVVPRKLKLLAA